MRIWITGGAGSGKSALAQELAQALALGGPLYYIATMVPRDDEDRRRIRRHIEDRDGMGFETIECPCRLVERIAPDPEGTYLLDSATALLANAMFGEREFAYRPEAAQEAARDLLAFSAGARHLVAVSDGIFSDAAHYDEMTETYRRGLSQIQRRMAAEFDTVLECAAGGVQVLKGEWPVYGQIPEGESTVEVSPEEMTRVRGGKETREERQRMELIIGGAFQGKRAYARAHYHLEEAEIFTCSEEADPEFGARCIDHLERYLRRCALNGKEPASPDAFRPDAVLICEDITCGVVPVDRTDRQWRELTGRYWQKLVRSGAGVTRVIAGLAQRLDRMGPDGPDGAGQILPARDEKTRADEKQILLVRHGKTRANEKHLYCGSTDLPLSEEGRALLKAGAEAGCSWGQGCARDPERKAPDSARSQNARDRRSFYTSGTKRTDETLKILFGEAALQRRSVREGLREMDFGRFEGKSYEELKAESDYLEWISGDNEKNVCPGGESGRQMRDRVLAAFFGILWRDPAQRIVIVTHGGPIAAIMQELFPEKGFHRYAWQPACGEGYLLTFRGPLAAGGEISYREWGGAAGRKEENK